MSKENTAKKGNLRKVSQIFRSDNSASPRSCHVPAQHTQDIPNDSVTNPSCYTTPSIPFPSTNIPAKGNILRKVPQIFKFQSDSPHSDVPAQHTQDISNNTATNPSCYTPPSIPLPASPSTDIPKNILAFCTITVLLSKIQQERAFRVSSRVPLLAAQDRQQLKLSNAFSTLAVIKDEVVAVVSKFDSDKSLGLLASINQNATNENLPIASSPKGLLSKVWNILFTKNYCWSGSDPRPTTISSSKEPTISDAGVGMNFVDDEQVKQYVDNHW